MRTYPGKTLTIYEVPALVKEAQLCALVPRNILSGFKNTETWPYNPDIFAEEDFAATTITDRPAPDIQIPLINDLPVDSARSSACSSQSMLIGNGPNTHTMQAGSSVDDAILNRAEKTTSTEHFAAPSSTVYVSPSDVYSIPKAQPRKSKSSARKGKTQILTSTPVKEKCALLKKQKEVKKVTKPLFCKKKKIVVLSESSSEEENVQIEYDDNTNCSIDDDIGEGDYVVVNVTGKARVVRYIARVDEVNDGEYEGVFLHKVPSCLKDDCISFIIDEKDDASFFASDIVFKLPPPVLVGGTARRAKHLRFNCDFKKWNVI